MPIIHFYGGKLDGERKREMVRDFSRAASRATGLPEEKIITIVHVTDADDVAVGGDIIADRR